MTETVHKAGEMLPNGTILLAETIFRQEGDGTVRSIVLVVRDTHGSNPDRFVTWERWITHTSSATGKPTIIEDCGIGHYHRDLAEALADYEARAEGKTHEKRNREAIGDRAYEDGKNAASWLVDGNTDNPEQVLQRLLDGIEGGDPEVMDSLPQPRLSGEFADDPTWEDICQAEIERYNDDGELELYSVYIERFHDGVWEEIVRMRNAYRTDDHSEKV